MIDIERLDAVPTFVLLGKDDCQTVAAYLYESCALINLDLSRMSGGFIFLDTYCYDGAKEHDAIMDSDNFERVGYDGKTRKAFVIRYRCEDGEDRVIGYCYTTDGQTMYGEYLKTSVGAPEIVQWHGKNAKELMREIAQESNVDLNNKSVVYKGYKGKEATNENTPQDFPKVRAACVQFAEALKWKEEAQEKLDAINANFDAACALLPQPIPLDTTLDVTVYLNPTKAAAFEQLILGCGYAIAEGDEKPTFGVNFGIMTHTFKECTVHRAINDGMIMLQNVMRADDGAMSAISNALDKITPERVDEIVATLFLRNATHFDINKI